jgi:hypothetical protein
MLRELELSRALIYAWHQEYGQSVLDEQIDVESAVDRFLSDLAQDAETL